MSATMDVHADDGTVLAVWSEGDGPAMVLVHGSLSDHTTLAPLVDVLAGDLTTFSVDRRGYGASGDAPGYTIERDFADVACVVDAVAARTGGPVALFGHSYGANGAMGAAARTGNVHHLVLYEPSLGLRSPPGWVDALEDTVASGDRDRAVVTVLVDVLGMSEEQVDALRAGVTPPWATRTAAAHAIPREARAEEGWTYRPGQFDTVTAPTLLLTGSGSPPDLRAATHAAAEAIPGSRIHVLAGHGHLAHKTDPEMVAAIVREFVLP